MRRSARDELRSAVQRLPRHTRAAMLEGLRDNDIIAGAYVDRRGGVCPMLAAHRRGGRTDFPAFAIAWDRFTRARRPRRANARELRTLEAYLRDSLTADGPDLRVAIAEHQRAARARRAREAWATGWGWLAEAEAAQGSAAAAASEAQAAPAEAPAAS